MPGEGLTPESSLEDLAKIRGGMWSQGLPDLPWGPRAGDPTNIIDTGALFDYSEADQDRILAHLNAQAYTHADTGPIYDGEGYHGHWPSHDWTTPEAFSRWLDLHEKIWSAGIAPVTFLKPDNWTFEQFEATMARLLADPAINARAQRLIRIIVPAGWEPTKYDWSSNTWLLFFQWGRRMFPNALCLVHTVSDVDACVGTDARGDDNGKITNGEAWQKHAPYLHGWLTQSNAFENPTERGDPNHPEKTNFDNWTDNFDVRVEYGYANRFRNGHAGWPTGSAFGPSVPMKIYAGEYSAYWRFNHADRTQAEGMAWGDRALGVGADGAFDEYTAKAGDGV